MSDSAREHCKTRGCVRHSRVSVPVQCHILLRCARGLNRDQVSLSEDGRADREDGERGTGGPLGGIQLFEPSVCNGMARLGGDKPIGKPSRAVSRCGLGLWMRVGGSSLGLALWHVGGCKGDTRRVLSDKDPRYPVLVDRGGAPRRQGNRSRGRRVAMESAFRTSPLLLSRGRWVCSQ